MRQNKYCNCEKFLNKAILKTKTHYFCEKCGCVILKDSEGNIFYTLKSKHKILPYDLSPITIIKNMKKKTEEHYPFIYEDYIINKVDYIIKEKYLNSINIYIKYRKMLLQTLQRLVKDFDYSDKVFYQCLFFLDTYLSHHINEDYSEKKILYYLVGYFICSAKFKETDGFELPLSDFYNIRKNIYLSADKIASYEVICLKKINYNFFSYSAYDWASQLISNGIVFNCEIDKNNDLILIKGHRHSLINTINKYVIKLLLDLTSKDIFFKYCPMYIALSLILIAREIYINETMIKPELFCKLINIYGINPDSYKKCYEEIKDVIKESNDSAKDNKHIEIEKQNNVDLSKDSEINLDLKSIERSEIKKKSNIKKRNDPFTNKNKIKNVLFNMKDDLVENDKEKPTMEKQKLSLNEIISNKKYIMNSMNLKNSKSNKNLKSIEHISINCDANSFKTSFDLPHIKSNSLIKKKDKKIIKELKYSRPNSKRFNTIGTKNKEINLDNDLFSTEKEIEINNEIKKPKLILKKSLYNIKLPKISNFEDNNIATIKTNFIEQNVNNNIYNHKKHYKLKTNLNHLELKLTLPQEQN